MENSNLVVVLTFRQPFRIHRGFTLHVRDGPLFLYRGVNIFGICRPKRFFNDYFEERIGLFIGLIKKKTFLVYSYTWKVSSE